MMLGYAILAFIVAGFSEWLAQQKGYGRIAWFFLGLIFNLVALLTIIGAPDKTGTDRSRTRV
jgi:hypothetical protein